MRIAIIIFILALVVPVFGFETRKAIECDEKVGQCWKVWETEIENLKENSMNSCWEYRKEWMLDEYVEYKFMELGNARWELITCNDSWWCIFKRPKECE